MFSISVMSDSLQPHEPQHAKPPCPSPSPGAYSNSCPLSRWCHPTISSSVIPFSCPQSFTSSGSFPMSQLFTSGGQRIGVSASASVLPMNIQDWSPLGWTGWISLQSKGLSRVFSSTTIWNVRYKSNKICIRSIWEKIQKFNELKSKNLTMKKHSTSVDRETQHCQMSALPKLTYGLGTISIKIQAKFLWM